MTHHRHPTKVSPHRLLWLPVIVVLTLSLAQVVSAQHRPAGEIVWAWHVTIAPAWFDPAEAPPQITPFGILYALHDALVHPMPFVSHTPRVGVVLEANEDYWRKVPNIKRITIKGVPKARPAWRC